MKSEVFIAASEDDLRTVLSDFCRRHPNATLLSVTQSESQSGQADWSATVVIFFKE